MKEYIRKDLRGFIAYEPHEYKDVIKLDANESPFNLPDIIRNQLIYWFENNENLNLYPDTNSMSLRKEIAKLFNISEGEVIAGVGSDQIIDCILRLFISPGDCVLIPTPSFSMYKLSTLLNHGKAIEFNLNENYSYNVEEIIRYYNKYSPKLIFLCTPNNPTGTILTETELTYILEKVECPVIVDEAYAEFTNFSAIRLINKYKNLIVLRTFSKAYGLAGLRVGYGVGCKEMISLLNIVKPPYNLSSLSALIAEMVLKNKNEYKEKIDYIVNERDRLYNEICKINGITIYKSNANYIFIRSCKYSLWSELLKRGILVRNFKEDTLKGCLRITVGSKEKNDLLINAIKDIMEVKM